jgi:hypothetical protein
MHSNFIGLFAATCGAIAWELVQLGHFGDVQQSVKLRLDLAFLSFTGYLRRHGLRTNLRSFVPATFNSPSEERTPELCCKAHDCRVILGWLCVESEKAADIGTMHGKRRYSLAWCQREISQVLEEAPRYMVEPYLSRFVLASKQFLDLYVSFCEEFKDCHRWALLRKVHTFAHLVDDVQLDLLNPRYYSGWTDETLMCKVVQMGAGRDCRTLSETVLRSWWPMFVQQFR